ncbi:receptor-like protein EIX1 isoform X2 [Populus nigra]|uniref:receptor-like protein EIX1 isoform X2 n=1 Tax=Populus nigra TaxID=3691 RepID=UPI002B27363A|nr:receptor-like protein EIX1 isoform X2 [Populus nigra]
MLLIKHDKLFHLLYVLIVLLLLMKLAPGFISGVKGATFGCIERERQALLKFKEDLIDDFGLLSTWGSEEEKRDCCKWRGVRCNNLTGHVTHLDLSGFNLSQTIDWLQVPNKLPRLHELLLRHCSLSIIGSPSLSLANPSESLAIVDFSDNQLTSSIFYWLANFGNSLVDLDLSHNHLQGSIPDAFKNMTSLRTLNLSSNQLQGDLSSFGQMCSLNKLYISENNLTGKLSQLFGCVENSLEILQLDRNQLHGSLPDITRFTFMRELNLSWNQLNGSLPERFSQRSELVLLYLNDNQLIGSLTDVAMLSSLRELGISNNRLDGNVSESIGSLFQLEKLHVGGNSLKGVMSEAHFSNLSKLTVLDLSDNSLALKFESNWAPTFQLDDIFLSSCNLGPPFPQWLRNQNNFVNLDISNTGISDTIPDWFWNLSNSNLQLLDLSHNKMSGFLPDFSSKYSNLQHIDLSFNQFEGPLPLFSSDTTSALFLSNNKFSGPASFPCNTGSGILGGLDLSNNLLTGWIPDCLMNFTSLGILNLASNNFSGALAGVTLTGAVTCLTLTGACLKSSGALTGLPSSGALTGLPLTGALTCLTLTEACLKSSGALTGNLALCGQPLLRKCPGDETNQSPPANDDNRGKEVVADEFMKWFCTAMGIGFSVLFWGVSGALLLKRSWRHAYFLFLDESWDWLCVKVALRKARIQREFQRLREHVLA